MKNFSVKNFKKYENLDSLEFSKINLLVGPNNSGKSTIVKGMVLLYDFLYSGQLERFYFGKENKEIINITSFDRAINYKLKREKIDFIFQVGEYRVKLVIRGNPHHHDLHEAFVCFLSVRSNLTGHELKIDYWNDLVFTFGKTDLLSDKLKERALNDLMNSEIIFRKRLSELKSKVKLTAIENKEKIELIDSINKINDSRKLWLENKIYYECSYGFDYAESSSNSLEYLITLASENYHNNSVNDIINTNTIDEREYVELQSNYDHEFLNDKRNFNAFIRNFFLRLRSEKYQYISANIKKHSGIFLWNDKTSHIAQAIHEFYTKGLHESGSDPWHFVVKWMKEFSIGDGFKIHCFEKEAYKFEITEKRKTVGNLAEMGTGSIQVMTIILNLALAIYRADKEKTKPVLMIEEPEIALHPKHQSMLADLFYDASNYDITFFIETHSEYLVRKTQLLVKEHKLQNENESNPFTVYYFDGVNQPYKMNYREDGKFIEDFGTGFYDISAGLTLGLF
jgi:predicted ATP-dependent endonuclease of OLD family